MQLRKQNEFKKFNILYSPDSSHIACSGAIIKISVIHIKFKWAVWAIPDGEEVEIKVE